MKGKHHKRYKKNNQKFFKLIIFILFLFFVFIMIITGIKIYRWLIENKNNDKILDNLKSSIITEENENGSQKYNINFNELKQKNNDTVAWIKVNGTNIEYPIVKSENNDYYLNHSFDKSINSAGWVFADYRVLFDGNDKNIVIYAHNRRDGSMFGTLNNIFTENWQNNIKNHIITFIFENVQFEYQVFSIYKVEKEDYYITTNFKDDSEFQEFIDNIKVRSIKEFGVNVSNEDQILTLSTCANNNRYRVVLHAKKINK